MNIAAQSEQIEANETMNLEEFARAALASRVTAIEECLVGLHPALKEELSRIFMEEMQKHIAHHKSKKIVQTPE